MSTAAARRQAQDEAADRVVVETGALAAAMSELARVVEGKQLLPILENVMIEPGEAGMRLTTTNLDMQYSVPLGVVEGGLAPVTVQAKRLGDVVSAFEKGSQCRIEIEGQRMTLRSGRSRATLPTLWAGDFPKVSPCDESIAFRMEGGVLRGALELVRRAISKDETKFHLCGVNMAVHNGMLAFAATDLTRFAMKEVPAPDALLPLDGADDIILPAKLVTQLCAMDEAGWYDLAVARRKQLVVTTPSGRQVIAKLLDSQYHRFRHVLGGTEPYALELVKTTIAAALNRVRLMADDKYRTITLAIAPAPSADDPATVTLTARAQDGAEIVEEVPCEWNGPAMVKHFNAALLRDQIDVLEGEAIELRCGDDLTKPNWMHGADAEATFCLLGLRG